MILYHGTNMDFDTIDFSQSKRYKDFGRGFYLTDIRLQAEELARKRAILNGGKAFVQEYEFDELWLRHDSLKVLHFENASIDWARFIYQNRNRTLHFTHDYDIVIGPIADDRVAYLLDRYKEGSYTLEELADKLKYKHLNNQYFFGTNRSIALLKRRK